MVSKGKLTDVVWSLQKTSGFQFISKKIFDTSNNKITSSQELFEYSGLLFMAKQDYLFTFSASINFGFEKKPSGFFIDDAPEYQNQFSTSEYEIHIFHSFKPSTIFSIQPFLGFLYFNSLNTDISSTTNDYFLHDYYHTMVGGFGVTFDPWRWFSFHQDFFFSPYTSSDVVNTTTHFSIYYASTKISFYTNLCNINILFNQKNIFDIKNKEETTEYSNSSSVTEFGISFSLSL